MATGPGVNQGKTAFAERFFTDHRDADEKAVNQAWRAAGNEGELSGSLIYQVRARLGLTGKKRADGGASGAKKGTGLQGKAKAAPKTAKGGPEAEPTPQARPQEERREAGAGMTTAAAGSNSLGDRERVLDRVEDRIDDLIIELKQLGGMEEALEALRKVRRVVVRSHEG